MAFVHLHNHTEYSMLDGAIKIKDMLDKAEKCGMQSIAITDHGNMFGAIDFYQAAEKRGIKPIFGCEFYLSPDSRKNRNYGRSDLKYYHLICLAENLHGYKNLMELSSIGYKEGFYYKPRIDKECLREHSKGLIGLSACVQGEIPYLLIHNSPEKARFALTEYLDIFGEGNFFLELQDHGLESERQAAPLLMELSRESGVPLAATNDMHYLDKEDFEAHESLLCIGTRTVLSDPNRMRFNSDQIYFKTEEEMRTVFPDNPEVFDITVKIAERCNVKLSSNLFWPEARKPPEFRTDQEYLRHLSYEGAKKKYSEITPEIKERLELELSIMDKMEASGYMLIVRDFISRAREIDVPVGPGRGSCVGSLVAYCLGITAVEPLRYSLLFERFLNPERQSMPDIDVDFADRDRQRVIDYVTKKYGRDAVCQIGTIGRMKAKAVIRDVGRVMEVPLPEVDKIAKLIDQKSDLAGSYNDSVEFRQLIDSSALYKKMFDISRRLEGLARQPGVHAAGVIIAPRPVVECAPVFVAHGKNGSEDTVASQYDGHFVEDVGLLKMDFLGLRNLTVIKDALFWIKKNYGKDIDMENVDLDDPDAYGLFSEGRTVGVFQFESPGMREYLKTLKPTCLEDLIAMCALYRPGPMDNIPSYINRKHGKEEPTYYHELLKPVLISTYGIFIYQEQVMQAAQVMAGYSLGQADLLRRAMGKKKIEAMKKHREIFIKGAAEKKIPESKAVEIFEVLEKFASYGFNKSHAAAYAFLAYQTAYLKTKYPQEFMAANMTSELQDNERITVLMDDCKKMGIDVLPPDINKSYHNFVPLPENKIMFGLAAIKNVGQGVTEEIIKERDDNGPYSSIFDFVLRMEGKMNRRTLESLIYSGALDSLPGNRARQFNSIDVAYDYYARRVKEKKSCQISLFGGGGESTEEDSSFDSEPELADVAPWTFKEMLQKEKETLGFYVSGHPLDDYRDELNSFCTKLIEDDLKTISDDAPVIVGGVIKSVRPRLDKRGRSMAHAVIEDFHGTLDLTFFSSVWDTCFEMIIPDRQFIINGKLQKRGDYGTSMVVDKVMPLENARESLTKSIHVAVDTTKYSKEKLEEIKKTAMEFKGPCTLVLHVRTNDGSDYVLKSANLKVSWSKEFLVALRRIAGEENVVLGRHYE